MEELRKSEDVDVKKDGEDITATKRRNLLQLRIEDNEVFLRPRRKFKR